jgi:hypothetical protein
MFRDLTADVHIPLQHTLEWCSYFNKIDKKHLQGNTYKNSYTEITLNIQVLQFSGQISIVALPLPPTYTDVYEI